MRPNVRRMCFLARCAMMRFMTWYLLLRRKSKMENLKIHAVYRNHCNAIYLMYQVRRGIFYNR